MRKVTLSFLLIMLSFPSWSADLQKGAVAFQNGDFATAIREWKPLAEQGNAYAQFFLGVMYTNGEGVLQDYKTAVKWYTLAAEQGHSKAQHNLGTMYANGDGVPQNYQTAVKWYTLAAEQGAVRAQFNLGELYYLGKGVLQDKVYSHMWHNIASFNGFEGARKNRDLTAKELTPQQLADAQRLARECVAKNYKGC